LYSFEKIKTKRRKTMKPEFSRSTKSIYRILTLSIAVLGLITQMIIISDARPIRHSERPDQLTSDAVVLQWNEIAYNRLPAGPPHPTARFMATVQLAVFEAVNAITGKYQPYLGTITAPEGASPVAAAIAAAHDALVGLFPAQAADLDSLRDNSLAAIPDGQAKTDGIAVGQQAAAAMLANRTNDGFNPPILYMPTSSDPYQWQVTPGPCSSTNAGVLKQMANVRPFGIESASQFRAEPPPALDSGVYAHAFNEVQRVGAANASLADRPADRDDVARLYAVTNVANNNSLLQQIAKTRNDEITDTARTLAILNMAMNDAFVSVFDSKYFYTTWRPVTAIPRADEDGNMWTVASSFTPLIGTPCFPSYPSAHGTATNAVITVLVRAYGRFGHSVTVSHPAGKRADGSLIELSYTDLRKIVSDVSDARVYGGIHFRFDQDAGERQGHSVAQYVYNNVLKKVEP
jgi:hypothetical protein